MGPDESAADRLARLAGSVRIPESLRDSLSGDPGEPRPNQVWRLRWHDTVELAAIVRVSEGTVKVLPVDIAPPDVDAESLMLAPDQSSLGTPLAVWIPLQREVPMHVLDRAIGEISYDLKDPAWPQKALHTGARTGRNPVNLNNQVFKARARHADNFDTFATSAWAPAGSGELWRILKAAGVQRADLRETLGLTPQAALGITRGQRPISASQASLLARRWELSADELMDANPAPPPALVQAISRPKWRAKVRLLAVQQGIDEVSAWVRSGFAVAGLAYRQTGQSGDFAWDERIEQYFQANLE
ncbi:hypothetical protein [Glycomyces sp. NPDC048151]|uniref:hypothetical protein n=1 Tax=Glycomyces sp. NPDC048151 TaxID=3364002 RepID=UPI003711A3AB